MAIFTSDTVTTGQSLVTTATEISTFDGTIQLEFTDLDNDDNKIILKVSSNKLIHRGSAATSAAFFIPPRGVNTSGIRYDGWRLLGSSVILGDNQGIAQNRTSRAVMKTNFGEFGVTPAPQGGVNFVDAGRRHIYATFGKIRFSDTNTTSKDIVKTGSSAVGRVLAGDRYQVEPGSVVFGQDGTSIAASSAESVVNIGTTVSGAGNTLRSGTGLAVVTGAGVTGVRRIKLDDIGFSYNLLSTDSVDVLDSSLLFTSA